MPKLCQINALVSGRKGESEKFVGDIYKVIQKEALFSGFERVYRPLDELNGEKLPAERQKVQVLIDDMLNGAAAKWSELWDLTATQDKGNQSACSDVVVDGKVVLAAVPVTSLLFLEKQVNDLETFVSKLPTPDASETWTHDPTIGMLRSGVSESIRTRKEPSSYLKAPATKEHPAQVEFFYKDVPVGTWSKTNFSGTIQADKKNAMLANVKKLKDAIKFAREQANLADVEKVKIGEPIFRFVFGK